MNNIIKGIVIKLVPEPYPEEKKKGRVLLELRVRVGMKESSYRDILYYDHFKSRYDQIMDIAKEELRRVALQDDEEGE